DARLRIDGGYVDLVLTIAERDDRVARHRSDSGIGQSRIGKAIHGGTAVELIGAGTAGQRIIASTASDRVVAASAIEPVGPGIAGEGISIAASEDSLERKNRLDITTRQREFSRCEIGRDWVA